MSKTTLNEQLNQLVLEAGGSFFVGVNTDQMKKFAELLIQQAIDVAHSRGDNVAYLKQHFGVE